MQTDLAHTFTIYWQLLGVQLRSQLQYRASFAMDLLSSATILVLEFGSLGLVLARLGDFQGWTFGEVAFLYGLMEFSFGLMDLIFSGFDPHWFGHFVRKGQFDQLLLRPVNITWQVLGSALELRRMGKVVMSTLLIAYALSLVDITWTAVKLAYLPVVVLSMVAFFGGLFISGATISFWFIESIEIMNVLTYGVSFLIGHPMHIYTRPMRHFFTYVIPAIFLNYYPALYILDKPDPFNMPAFAPLLSPVIGMAMLLLGLRFWRFGISRYQSTGT